MRASSQHESLLSKAADGYDSRDRYDAVRVEGEFRHPCRMADGEQSLAGERIGDGRFAVDNRMRRIVQDAADNASESAAAQGA
jgi:hypothetical protein